MLREIGFIKLQGSSFRNPPEEARRREKGKGGGGRKEDRKIKKESMA